MTLRNMRIVLWVAAGLVAALAVAVLLGGLLSGDGREAVPASVAGSGIGGSFSMVDQSGRAVTEADFEGRPQAMFFGFTSCPDICPTMLTQMSNWLDELGPLADRIQPIFVSVDPERDTVDVIKKYLSAFDPRITGLTGTPEQVASFAKNYGVFYEKVPTDGGDYTMNHTANILLFGADGSFRGTADYHDDPADAQAKLRRLAENVGVGNG